MNWFIRGLTYLMYAFDKRKQTLEKSQVRSIAVFSMTAIGDTFMSTPAIDALRQTYPQAKITLIVHPNYLCLFKNLTTVDDFLTYRGRWGQFWSLVRALRKKQVDLAIILHGNEPQATPLAYLSGAKWRYKLPMKHQSAYLLTQPDQAVDDKALRAKHAIDQRLQTAQLAGCEDVSHTRMFNPLAGQVNAIPEVDTWFEAQSETLEQKPTLLVGIQLGASRLRKCWSLEKHAQACMELCQQFPNLGFVLTGSPAERAMCERFQDLLPGNIPVINSAGQIALAHLPYLLAKLDGLLTGDTGTMHMAVAVGTPTVSLFASTNSAITGPYQDLDRHIIIQKWKTCTPCQGSRCPYQPATCMENITVTEVVQAVSCILEKAKDKP